MHISVTSTTELTSPQKDVTVYIYVPDSPSDGRVHSPPLSGTPFNALNSSVSVILIELQTLIVPSSPAYG